jgi:hypothetical protein
MLRGGDSVRRVGFVRPVIATVTVSSVTSLVSVGSAESK